jgi:hypothetical protein
MPTLPKLGRRARPANPAIESRRRGRQDRKNRDDRRPHGAACDRNGVSLLFAVRERTNPAGDSVNGRLDFFGVRLERAERSGP